MKEENKDQLVLLRLKSGRLMEKNGAEKMKKREDMK